MTRKTLVPRDPLAGAPDAAALAEQQRRLEQLRRDAARHAGTDYTQSPRARREQAARRRRTPAGYTRISYDLPVELIDAIEEVARRLRCSMSSAVTFLVIEGLALSGEDRLRAALEPSRSPRFEFALKTLPDLEAAKTAFFEAASKKTPGSSQA